MRRSYTQELVDSILAWYLARSPSVELYIVSAAECSCGPNSRDHHEITTITHRYAETDLAMKENGFARLEAPSTKTGKLRLLAVAEERRSPLMPDLSTIAESGVPGYEISPEIGFVAPAGTPKDIIEKLEQGNREGAQIA